MMTARSIWRLSVAALLVCALAGPSAASDAKPAGKQPASQEKKSAEQTAAPGSPPLTGHLGAIKAYCENIRDLAKDARHQRQFNELKALSAQVDAKVKELRERTAEYRKWYEMRQKFSERATDGLVKIYSKMRPDSAAAQLTAMDDMMAAALLIKLNTRVASAVLNEIEPKKAAIISGIISAAARKKAQGGRS